MYQKILSFLVLAFVALPAVSAWADDDRGYKSYQGKQSKQPYFEIEYDNLTLAVIIPQVGAPAKYVYDRKDVISDGERVTADGHVLFDQSGLRIEDSLLTYDRITDILIQERHRKTAVIFYTRDSSSRRFGRVRRGNLTEPFKPVKVTPGQFVRGYIMTIAGDVEVNGETNKDVVSLFGRITVGPEAVIRGNVLSLFGQIDIDRTATLYGDVYTSLGSRSGRNYRLYRGIGEFFFSGSGYYNRVDGLAAHLKVGYQDRDSLLPSVKLTGGYAFHSERGRYLAEIEQPISRRLGLYLGGSAFQLLESDDSWLLSRRENSAYALVATEDYMDYYESRGASGYVRLQPLPFLKTRLGYRYEETNWLEAGRNLWSLFGGSKRFELNFPMFSDAARDVAIGQIDESTNATLNASIAYDNRATSGVYTQSGWFAGVRAEWSHPDFGSDFDYRRFVVQAGRFQKVTSRSLFMVRGMTGNSSGALPAYKLFYLGGLGALRGYDRKEFIGSEFWMVNSEYRIQMGRTDFALSIFWDVANIPEDARLSRSDNTNHSIGSSLYLGSDFRVSLAQRLDSASDRDPQVYVRLTQGF